MNNNMTNTTTPAGDEDLPPLPIHPEAHSMTWSELEKDAMRDYARAAIKQHMERQAAPSEAQPVAQTGWTGNMDADLALILLGRLDVPGEENARIDQLEGLVRKLAAQAQPVAEPIDFSAEFTRAKNLIVRLWNTHPSTRPMIEGATGSWFVWGTDRNATPEKG